MTTVVVPFGGYCPYRLAAWDWVSARYREHHPDWTLTMGLTDGEWVKADAVMPAIESAADGVVVVADADVWTDGLQSAVRAVTAGVAEWAIPHGMVYRLSEESTRRLLEGEEPAVRPQRGVETWTLDRRPYEGVPGGGIVVAHRDTLLKVPLDPRFKGPGQEDESFGYALQTLAGNGWRGNADLIHCWHPPLPRLSTRRGSVESWDLYRRYADAAHNHDAMKSLIEEVQVDSAVS